LKDEGQICRLHRVTENAAIHGKKVESLFHCLPKKLPPEFSRQPNKKNTSSIPK